MQVPHIHSIVCHEESGPGFSDDASAIAAPFLTDAAGTTRHSREFPAVPGCSGCIRQERRSDGGRIVGEAWS